MRSWSGTSFVLADLFGALAFGALTLRAPFFAARRDAVAALAT